MEHNTYELKLYSEVQSVPVEWLWYPYIPKGKITLLQGDPGDGKSTMMMNLISCLTNAGYTPNGQKIKLPQKVIYQCSEDGIADTIKPRLEACGADCRRVAFIDEELEELTLDDERIRSAISDFRASLMVIDPFQAYLGDEANLLSVKKTRRLMQKLSIWASTYKCAIVLVGHMTKKENAKDLYRGMGSIDLVASARSVLQVYHDEEKPNIRYVKHVKSSLAPRGEDISFELNAETGFKWLNVTEQSKEQKEEIPDITVSVAEMHLSSKDEVLANFLADELAGGRVKATEIMNRLYELGIGTKALKRVKKIMGIKSVRRRGQWYWELKKDE